MTPTNENLQQAYMMLLNSKQYLSRAGEEWLMQKYKIEDLCEEISTIQNKVYEMIHFFDKVEEDNIKDRY